MVEADFEDLFMSHKKPNLFRLAMLKDFDVTETSFTPLIVAESEEFCTMAVQTILVFFTSFEINFVR